MIERDPKRDIDSLRQTLLAEFPNYRDLLSVNGVTHAEIYEFGKLDEELEATETAIGLITGTSKQ